jgi:osomolarity two-component system sensor histidine kinase NIK1
MMGDRERCIQAQMDEYLSKPLQQNHLIQTILKCATLGGALLEKNRERELARQDSKTNGGQKSTSISRPSLEARAITSSVPGASPSLIVASQTDPLQRACSTLSEPSR